MDDQECPKCKTTKYRNPSLKLLVNVCGHALCDNCVELLFVKGSGACPICRIPLRRNNFRTRLFEDAVVEKEVDIRKKILRDYNKKEDDFASLNEYNDYLEQVESIIHNLTHGVSVDATKSTIEQYRKENKSLIQKNKSKLSRDDAFLEELIEAEEMKTALRQKQLYQQERDDKRLKAKNRENLIDELTYSDAPAGHILSTHENMHKEEEKEEKPPVIVNFKPTTTREAYLPVPKDQTPLYRYEQMRVEFCGPPMPDDERLDSDGFLRHIRCATGAEKAGGFESNLACKRALQEALNGLYA
uniref:CDK-activating kinase assembly factor MAT1 n=1 Tax=Strigamia maritima TaxID=126957 RepID=T1JFU7_STRMM